jgi:hypothetical protein
LSETGVFRGNLRLFCSNSVNEKEMYEGRITKYDFAGNILGRVLPASGQAIRYKSAFNSKSGLPAEVISTQAGFPLLSLTQKKNCHKGTVKKDTDQNISIRDKKKYEPRPLKS